MINQSVLVIAIMDREREPCRVLTKTAIRFHCITVQLRTCLKLCNDVALAVRGAQVNGAK
jgi:hypothetical protein